jgi:hypothetical protein
MKDSANHAGFLPDFRIIQIAGAIWVRPTAGSPDAPAGRLGRGIIYSLHAGC